MKKKLTTEERARISDCLKMAETLIGSAIPLASDDVSATIGTDFAGTEKTTLMLRTVLEAALSELNKAQKMIEMAQ